MKTIFGIILILFLISCAPTSKLSESDITNTTIKPSDTVIFNIPNSKITREMKETKPDLLKRFPFISYLPVTDFNGKFPPEFYTSIKLKFEAENIKNVDYWSLRNNKSLYDIIYIQPLWIGEFTLKEDDLIYNIARSFNISKEQVNILDNWVKDGGILWLESALFISSYDYKFNNFDENKIKEYIQKLKSLKLFGNKINITTFTAKKIDEFNIEKLLIEIVPERNSFNDEILKDTEKLLLEQNDYVGIYITVDGTPIVKSGDNIFSSYVNHGKGKIITIAPFDFKNVYYDGEIFRINLLSWAMNVRK